MADNHGAAQQDSGMDYAEHERTYRLFISLIKSNCVAIIIALILLAYFTL